MPIDSLQKISDIILKGVIATAASVIAVYMTWQKNSGDLIKQCDSFYTALIENAAATKFTESAKLRLTFRIDNYNKMCERLSDAQVQNVLNLMIADLPVAQQAPSGNEGLRGWVALSRIPADQFADTNFDGRFSTGEVIKARWSVNVRQKNTPVSRGDNPVLGIIEGGTCVRIDERVTGQLNEWARISQQECPR